MKKTAKLCLVLFLTILITTGCWNLKEPNELAFVTGNGLDLTEEGMLEATALVVTPAGIGGGLISSGEMKESFHVISATGKNVSDAFVNIQSKLSRALFVGHREVFLVGHRLAEHGMGETIDAFIRNAQSDMRSIIYVVKDGQPKDILSIKPFFDPYITTSLSDEQKANGLKPYLAREFVEDLLSDGTQPLVPVVSEKSTKHYRYSGSAILNKDEGVKLVGFLNKKETAYARWITDMLTSVTLTSFVPQGDGNISLRIAGLDRRIRVNKVDEQIQIDIYLTGKGTIIENNTNLDPSKQKDLQVIRDALNKKTQKSIQQLIKKIQEEYKMDIFGFGEVVHKHSPHKWKTLKQKWNETFPQLYVSVNVDLQCNNSGQTDWSLDKP